MIEGLGVDLKHIYVHGCICVVSYMNAEALLRAVQYYDTPALLRFDPSLFRGKEIILTDEGNGARLPLLAMGIQEACTTRFGRRHIPDDGEKFLEILVKHCHLDVNKPFEIHRRPSLPSVISNEAYNTHKYPKRHVAVMQATDVSCLIWTNPLSWAFYLFLEKNKRFVINYRDSIVSLLRLGAHVNSPFFFQITRGRMNPAEDMEWNARNGQSFLHLALESGDCNLVSSLLDARAKFNLAHDRGSLAKCIANVKIRDRDPEIVMLVIFKQLVKYFQNGHFDAADLQVLRSSDPTNGNTALHYLALYEEFQDCRAYIDFLLDILASPFARNHEGLTPLDVSENTSKGETPKKQAFREVLGDAMRRWGDLVMRTMAIHEALEARGIPEETQEDIYGRVSGALRIAGSMSRAVLIKGGIMAARNSV